jgi:hypothetical protein
MTGCFCVTFLFLLLVEMPCRLTRVNRLSSRYSDGSVTVRLFQNGKRQSRNGSKGVLIGVNITSSVVILEMLR